MKGLTPTLAATALASVLLWVGAGCGDSGGAGGAGDGRFHPDASGVGIDETAACDALRAALDTKSTGLSCVSTFRVCPSLVRTESGEDCAQYDKGTIDGCVAYFGDAKDCDDLKARSESCAFEAIDGSAPGGC